MYVLMALIALGLCNVAFAAPRTKESFNTLQRINCNDSCVSKGYDYGLEFGGSCQCYNFSLVTKTDKPTKEMNEKCNGACTTRGFVEGEFEKVGEGRYSCTCSDAQGNKTAIDTITAFPG